MRALAPLWWTAGFVLVLDQITKVIVVQWLDLKTVGRIEVIDPFLVFRMAWNRGVNFGLFSGSSDATKWVLIAIALAITGWLVWWMRRDKPGPVIQISAGLVVGGAIGNVIDRLIYGAVADFLNMSCCGIENPYSFNVADISIFLGAIALILVSGDGSKGRDDGGKASYTCSHHQNLAGIKFTSSGHLAVQEALINICCFDDGTVTVEVGEGGEKYL